MGVYGPWTRQRVVITLVALAVIPWWKGGGGFLVSMPTVANAGMNQIVVGASPADQARYELRSPAEFEATVVDYQFNSFGMSGGFLKDMGARAMLAFASTDSYQSAVARSQRSGACLGSCLGNSTMTLILIPARRGSAVANERQPAHGVALSYRRAIPGSPIRQTKRSTGAC